jgi:uncharacterized RDD family membrane protein YckC
MKFDLPDQTDQDAVETAAAWSWPEASPGQRLIAFVIDAVFLTALGGFLEAAAQRAGFNLDDSGTILLGLVYFLLMHVRSGQTLGKKVVGIRVVEMGSAEQAVGLSVHTVLMRDLLGRSLTALTLLLGYFLILFRSDRRGIHDLVARTRVIALEDAKVIHFRYVAACGFGLLLAFGGAAYFAAYHTPWPLRKIVERMELEGWTAEGIGGSFASGYSISKLARSTSEGSIEINGLFFHYDPFGVDKNSESSFVIRSIGVESATMEILNWPEKDRLSSVVDRKAGEAVEPAKSVGGGVLPSRSFSIESLDLQRLKLKLPRGITHEIERVFVSDLIVRSERQEVSVGRVYVSSDWLDLDLQEVVGSAAMGDLQMNKPAHLVLKPGFQPEVIKSAIDVQLKAEFRNSQLRTLDVVAFRKRMNLSWRGDSGNLVISSWTPQHYFNVKAPVWGMDFKIAGNPMKMKFSGMEGSVGLRQHKFVLSGGTFVHEREGRSYFMLPKLGNWKEILSGKEAGMILTSQHRQSARDVLAELYFSKSFESLLPQELAHVERDTHHFADVGLPQKGPLLESEAKLRAPSSEKTDPQPVAPAIDAKPREPKSRLPMVLPPKKAARRGITTTESADRFSR